MVANRWLALVPATLFGVYAFVPGDPLGIISGWPWRDAGGILFAAVMLGGGSAWITSTGRRESVLMIVLVAAILARIGAGSYLVPLGWAAIYRVEENGAYRDAERIGPRLADARVIDRQIALSSSNGALQFLNDGVQQQGGTDAAKAASLDLRWTGHLLLPSSSTVTVAADGDGIAAVSIDRQPLATRGSPVSLSGGDHEVVVTLNKASGLIAAFSTEVRGEDGPIPVYARPTTAEELETDRRARLGLRGLDLLVVALGIVWFLTHVAALVRDARRQSWHALIEQKWVLVAIPLVLFSVQGLLVAHAQSGLTIYSVGDDMRQYASNGRDIILHGLLANGGKPLFQGAPFYFYPLYPYFVALSHTLFDESFYGVILLQFILLAATIAAVTCLAADLFGVVVACLSLVLLLALGEMDFVRYYTVAVFTDNLYYPLVAFSALALNRLERSPSMRTAFVSGLSGGLATITRPSMFFLLPLALLWAAWPRSTMPALTRQAIFRMAVVFTGVIALVTLRNWLVSGRVVLIAESSLQVLYFLAPPNVKWEEYLVVPVPSIVQTIQAAIRMFLDHPAGVVMVEARKLGFMLGFTNLGIGYRLHPEFVMLSATYFGCWLARKREMPGALVHLTILAHAVAFLIASPMSYGYKTMLTLMLLMLPFSAEFLVDAGARVLSRRSTLLAQAE